MKTKLLLITALALTLNVTAQVPNYVPASGLAGWWSFTGNANDLSGNGNNGTVNGATLTTDRFGAVNSAYSFNGISAYIRCSNAGPLIDTSRSVSFWLKSNSTNPGSIISYGNNDVASQDFRAILNSSCQGISTSITGNGKDISYVANNSWDFFTIVFDKSISNTLSGIAIYKNGVNQTTFCFSLVSSSLNTGNTNPITFGCYHWLGYSGNLQYFSGSIDDIGIWNRALTQCEITQLYTAQLFNFVSQPQNQTVNINNNAQFIASTADTSATFQWQTNLGLGWQNISNAGQYSGASNDTLLVSNTTLSNNNQLFRVIMYSCSSNDTSNVATLTINNNVGIKEIDNSLNITISPNPFTSQTTISFSEIQKNTTIKTMDMVGKEIKNAELILKNEKTATLDMSSYAKGVYFVQIKDANKNVVNRKIVVQ